jgi:hypothetical protein
MRLSAELEFVLSLRDVGGIIKNSVGCCSIKIVVAGRVLGYNL